MNWRVLCASAALLVTQGCGNATGPLSFVGEWSVGKGGTGLAMDLRIATASAATVTGELWLASSDTTRPACGATLTGANTINGGQLFADSLIFTIPAVGISANIRFRAVQVGGELVLSSQGQPDSHLLPC